MQPAGPADKTRNRRLCVLHPTAVNRRMHCCANGVKAGRHTDSKRDKINIFSGKQLRQLLKMTVNALKTTDNSDIINKEYGNASAVTSDNQKNDKGYDSGGI